jgi:uncharacterized protein (TIGR03437 family)
VFTSVGRLELAVALLLTVGATSANAAGTTFNLTGTFDDGSTFGPGSQITIDPSHTAGSAIGISDVNVTLVRRDGSTLATYTGAGDVFSAGARGGWEISLCTDYQLVFIPPQGTGDVCNSGPIVNIFLPVSLTGYTGGPLCITSQGGCFAPTTYLPAPASNTFEYLVSGSLLPSNAAPGNLPRFTFSLQNYTLATSALAMDSSGNSYFTAAVIGNPFTATPGAFQTKNAAGTCLGSAHMGPPPQIPCKNAFVVKLDTSGSVVFATYLGATGDVNPRAIAVDSSGNVYIAGNLGFSVTPSAPLFLVTPNAAFNSGTAFVAKLSADGTMLKYSTLLPSLNLGSLAIDQEGNAYFAGGDTQGVFPVTDGAYQTKAGAAAASTIVGKLNAIGSALVYATYLSGRASLSYPGAITLDPDGNAIVTGTTAGADFPATAGQFVADAPNGYNAFLAKLNADGSALIYSTLLGPGDGYAVKLDSTGDMSILCSSSGPDFPVTARGFGGAPSSGAPGNFLVRMGADGSSLLSSIYLPFSISQDGGRLDVDSAGNTYVAGYGTIETTPGAFHSGAGSPTSIVVAKIAPDGQVAGATYMGATTYNGVVSIAAERDGSVVVAGPVSAVDLPGLTSTPPSFFAANFFPAVTIENSASFVANTAVPGELVSIQGYGLGPVAGKVSTPVNGLGGVQVFFDSFAAPISYAQANQINAQVPWEVAGQATTRVRVVYNGSDVGHTVAPVGAALPGIFYINNSDGFRNAFAHPASAGDFVSIYGTGGGAMNLPGVTGDAWPTTPLSVLTQQVSATLRLENERVHAEVLYSGSVPTLVSGFFQINVQIPIQPGLASPLMLSVTVGGVESAPVPIWVEQPRLR